MPGTPHTDGEGLKPHGSMTPPPGNGMRRFSWARLERRADRQRMRSRTKRFRNRTRTCGFAGNGTGTSGRSATSHRPAMQSLRASRLAACAPHRLPVATASPQSGNDSRNITRPYQPAETTRCRTPPHAAATHARLATGHGNGQGSMRYIDETRLCAGACTLRGSGRTGCHSSLVAC